MKFLIETDAQEIFEVVTLFDRNGNETDSLFSAEACVIKFSEDAWADALIEGRTIHRVH